ncbi:MAG TPA: cellulose synthase operon protein YhjQ/BcsQ [Acidobacteriaceae bacterium]|jgi:cellulose synthase operon protein YhjQ|nr:cellulose synthase operon protein YhjQ/BcsQ [Acidobacteriaceae bacterium]
MDGQKPEAVDEQPRAETPEDVAVLYSWANLHGARYRDFSGSRRESRAQVRHRAAQEAREAERRAQIEAERAAAVAERAAREAEEIARLHEKAARRAAEARQRRDLELEEGARARAMSQATELSRRAASERVQAARRAEAAASAEAATRREAREIAEAHASAERQALRYAEAEMRRRTLAGPQPVSRLPGEISDPYLPEKQTSTNGRILSLTTRDEEDMRPARYPQTRDARQMLPPAGEEQRAEQWASPILSAEAIEAPVAEGRSAAETEASEDTAAATEVAAVEAVAEVSAEREAVSAGGESAEPREGGAGKGASRGAGKGAGKSVSKGGDEGVSKGASKAAMGGNALPAWLTAESKRPTAYPAEESSRVEETLQQSRELVASRWFALRGLFDQGPQEQAPEMEPSRSGEVPVLAVFSFAGGVGKTSLVATLGRALSSSGEKVLLTDTTSHGLLPFYFGANELKPGVVRTFAPPVGSADAPIHLLSFDLREKGGDLEAQEWLADELGRNSQGVQRVLVDLSPSRAWVAKRLARMNTMFLVPMAPDMNSVISLSGMERFFAEIKDGNDRPLHPCYLLNDFDSSEPLHLDVREVLRQQLGDRLLPFVVRRSPAIPEALAEGMTVMDYAPEAAVAGDFMNLASWLRTQSAPAPGFRKVRWSEQ